MRRWICSARAILLIGVSAGLMVAACSRSLAEDENMADSADAGDAAPRPYGANIPVTGEILPGSDALDKIDGVMKELLAKREMAGAVLAITHGGRLVVARGYGWADIAARKPMQPTTLVGLASVSKALTGVAAMKLVEDGRLKLDQPVFSFLGITKAPPGHKFDPRLRKVTVRMLLDHSGGWNRDKSGDPGNFGDKVHNELHVPMPVTIDQLIFYMNGLPLDFDPGTDQNYSNYGFAIMGEVIARITRESYDQFVTQEILRPMGIRDVKMTPVVLPGKFPPYLPGEAKRYDAGGTKALAPGHVLGFGSAGGWSGSAVGMARFMTAVNGTRTGETFLNSDVMRLMMARPDPPLHLRNNGDWTGLGWDTVRESAKRKPRNVSKNDVNDGVNVDPKIGDDVGEIIEDNDEDKVEGKEDSKVGNKNHNNENDTNDADAGPDVDISKFKWSKNGGLPGISTWVEHFPGGTDWVVLFNGRKRDNDKSPGDVVGDAQKEVGGIIRKLHDWPEGDLFEKYKRGSMPTPGRGHWHPADKPWG